MKKFVLALVNWKWYSGLHYKQPLTRGMHSPDWILITLATVIDSAGRHEIFSERLVMTLLFNQRTDEVLPVMKDLGGFLAVAGYFIFTSKCYQQSSSAFIRRDFCMWSLIFSMLTLNICIEALHRKYHRVAAIVTWTGIGFMVYLK